ncbi:DUF4252 domain-containing protein [Draconibacterium halophilum]|uniref:DUF4252 domain-containing protein n=1 Tax=Draconibacterium halophilum TaxID=2706887 RepID=A0A6C0RC13_9BACT|nr:DUF4252 domain-containing protein [Draconibacterium halophilum]QIA08188.1 DUF4252 domain-containing protein [Draconibacterium halophilum]
MKRIAFILLAGLFLTTSCVYESGVSEAYSKYRFKDGVTTVSVPGWVIHLAAGIGDLEDSERDLLESIDRVKVIAVDDDNLNARIDLHEEFYKKISEKKNYEELLVVREGNENVTIFGRMNESVIEEMVILVGGDDNALIFVKGEISPQILNDNIDLSKPDRFLSLGR